MTGRLALCLGAALLQTGMARGDALVLSASFADPTQRYDHGVLGDATEYGTLRIETAAGPVSITLPADHVFEDTIPRLWDIDGDGHSEVVVIETDIALGASLAIYDAHGLVAATPHIGATHRWLAPVGAGDLDGDGTVEIALIDRPHLARVLQIWRLEGTALVKQAETGGLTNHRIGDTTMTSGIRDCGDGPQIMTVNADWTQIMATGFAQGQLYPVPFGPYGGPASMLAALRC